MPDFFNSFLVWLYEILGGAKSTTIFYIVVIGIFALIGIFTARVIDKAVKDSLGSVNIMLSQADDQHVQAVTFQVFKNGTLERIQTIDKQPHVIELKVGSYTFKFQRTGYHDVEVEVPVLNGERSLGITLVPTPKTITVSLTDKLGSPYSNISFQLKRENDFSSHLPFTTNINGEFTTPTIQANVTYRIDLLSGGIYTYVSQTQTPPHFLWRKFKYKDSINLEVGHFKLQGTTNKVNVVLPKMLFTNHSSNYSLKPQQFKINQKLILAQPFELNEQLQIGGIGIRAFNFAQTPADSFAIVADNYGLPGSQELFATKEILIGDLSNTIQYPYWDFANEITLPQGKYWLVIHFNDHNGAVNPSFINPGSLKSTLFSEDGKNWASVTDSSEIDYCFIE